jgi:nucleoside-diphosphate-sugar epimerase
VKRTDYGFIGVGRMGAHMARRLLKAGLSLTVFDTSKDAVDDLVKSGAQAAGSALEVANATEKAFLSLPTPDIVTRVCAGLAAAKGLKESPTARRRAEGRADRAGRARDGHRLHGRTRERRHGRRATARSR